jgi:WD40 repeat protein
MAGSSFGRSLALAILVGTGGYFPPVRIEALAQEPKPQPATAEPAKPKLDRFGDPLPEHALCRFGTVRFRNPGAINGTALSTDGKTIATVSSRGVLRLIDTATGQARLTLRDKALNQGFGDGQCVLSFSHDGKAFLTAAGKLLDTSTGKEMKQFPVANGLGHGATFSPDGKQVALTGINESVFSDAATGKELYRVARSGYWLAYSRDSRIIALPGMPAPPGATDKTIRIAEAATGNVIRNFDSAADVLAAAFAPDNKLVAVAGKDHNVRLFEVGSGKEVRFLTHKLAEDKFTTMAFAPDGKTLAVGATNANIYLWDPASGKGLGQLEAHTWWITGLFFSPDSKTLYSTSWDETVRRWDVASRKEIRSGGDETLDQGRMARSPNGKLLATSGADGQVCIWEAMTGRRLHTLRGHGPGVFDLAFSPDGKRLGSCGKDMSIRLWDVRAGKELYVVHCENGPREHGRVHAVAFSPNGKLIAAANDSKGVVHVLDSETGKRTLELPHKGPATVAFSPDGKELATGGWDHQVLIRDVATGKQLRTLGIGQIVDSVAYSPDARLIATGHHSKPICLWDAATGNLVRELKTTEEVIWVVAFSPDGQLLASGGTDGIIRIWDVATGKEVIQRQGHEFWVMSLAFSPDGRTLASGGYDGVSYLWDMRPKSLPRPAGGAAALWDELGDDDPVKVYETIWALADLPEESLRLANSRLRPKRTKPDNERVRQLIADLDSDEFAKREAASQALAKLGDAIEPGLREALAKAETAEPRRRLEALLARLRRELSGEELRQIRAVSVLEMIGNDRAANLLRALADDASGGPVPRQAKAALERLARRAEYSRQEK